MIRAPLPRPRRAISSSSSRPRRPSPRSSATRRPIPADERESSRPVDAGAATGSSERTHRISWAPTARRRCSSAARSVRSAGRGERAGASSGRPCTSVAMRASPGVVSRAPRPAIGEGDGVDEAGEAGLRAGAPGRTGAVDRGIANRGGCGRATGGPGGATAGGGTTGVGGATGAGCGSGVGGSTGGGSTASGGRKSSGSR